MAYSEKEPKMETAQKCLQIGRLGVRGCSNARCLIELATSIFSGPLTKSRFVASLLLAAGFLMVTTHFADADTTKIINANVAGFISVEPGDPSCPGNGIEPTGTDIFVFKNGHNIVTIRQDGTAANAVFSGEGSFSQMPDTDSTVPTCAGHFAFWCGAEFNPNVTIPFDFTADIDMNCTDSSVFHLHWTGRAQFINGELHLGPTMTFDCG
jgi:hypothetical protein